MPKIATLHDKTSSDDDDEETRYVGGTDNRGGGSGLAVLPNSSDAPSPSPDDIIAAAQRGGSDGAPVSENARTITMWASGFQVDHGPYRPLSDPANKPFLTAIANGRVPPELLPPPPSDGAPAPTGGPIPIDVKLEDKRNQEYVKPDYVAFEGEGNRMDGGAKEEVEAVTSSEAAPTIDPTKEVVKIAVRTLTGSRTIISLNTHHTIADLSYLINHETGSPQGGYVLMSGFPPRRLEDGGMTVEDAGLKGGQVQMKKV
mmetsp:Transcript_14407/g.29641  ORF Transcript_14407/g.29641 Transcript_14407/m.29641 type:complete len:258 (-) Transcript_14407:36-809(-)